MFERLRNWGAGMTLLGALLAYAGCAEKEPYLEGAVELGENTLDRIGEEIEAGKYRTKGVKLLVDKANPLFDYKGNPVEENYVVNEGIDIVVERTDYYFENGRIFGFYEQDFPDKEGVYTFFYDNETPDDISDDFLLLNIDSYKLSSTIMYSKVSHGLYGDHSDEMQDFLEIWEAKENKTRLDDELIEFAVEDTDFPYLVTFLYEIVRLYDSKLDWELRKFELFNAGDIVEDHQEGDPCVEIYFEDQFDLMVYVHGSEKNIKNVLGLERDETFNSITYIYKDYMEGIMEAAEEADPNHEVFCWYL